MFEVLSAAQLLLPNPPRRRSLNDKERNQPATQRGEEGRMFILKSNTIRRQNLADPTFSPDSDLAQGCRGRLVNEMESRGAARRSCGEDATHSREWVPRRGKKNIFFFFWGKISHYYAFIFIFISILC